MFFFSFIINRPPPPPLASNYWPNSSMRVATDKLNKIAKLDSYSRGGIRIQADGTHIITSWSIPRQVEDLHGGTLSRHTRGLYSNPKIISPPKKGIFFFCPSHNMPIFTTHSQFPPLILPLFRLFYFLNFKVPLCFFLFFHFTLLPLNFSRNQTACLVDYKWETRPEN